MKRITKICGPLVIAAMAVASTSCMTTYDAQGRPVQTVDPGAAAAGAVAAGAIGYAIGQNNNDRNYYYYGGRRHHHHGPYRRW